MTDKSSSGRFQASISDEEAAIAVAAVSCLANPDDPQHVSQRSFDSCRAAAGYPDLPSARALCKRISITWPDLLRASHAPPTQRTRQLSYGRRNTGRNTITLDDCVAAIGRVARRAGKDTLTRGEYEKQRKQMLDSASRAHKQNRPSIESLPTLNQLDSILRQTSLSWGDARRRAAVKAPRRPASPSRMQKWTPSLILEGLRKATGLLEGSESLTQRRLKQLSVDHPGIPGWSIVHDECRRQGIGFAELKQQAGLHKA